MTREQEQLLALVRLAIHPEEASPMVLSDGNIDWAGVFDEAKKQSLVGIAYVGIVNWSDSEEARKKKCPIEKVLLTKWYGLAEKIKQDNLLANKRTAQVCRNFAKAGFRTSVMKGQGNALYYDLELSLFRAPGDIDVWVEGGFQKVYDYVQSVRPTNVIDEIEIEFNVFSDVPVEVHYRPYIMKHPFRNRRLQKFFLNQAEECFTNHIKLDAVGKDGEDIKVDAVITTIHFNLIHQLAHIKLHLFNGGVGLRQIMDYFYQLKEAKMVLTSEQKKEIIGIVNSLGLEKVARSIAWILESRLGLPKEHLLWESDKEDGEFLLNEIFRTGNFGHWKKDRRVIKRESFMSFYSILKQNLSLFRYDRTDWFWGSLWSFYHFAWRKMHGFRH